MAKEKTTIGFSRSTTATVVCVVIVVAALAFWKDRGGSEAQAKAADTFLLNSHEKRITSNQRQIGEVRGYVVEFKEEVKDRFVGNEKMQISLQRDQQAILGNQTDMKLRMTEERKLRAEDAMESRKLRIEQIKEMAELSAYLRTLEKIEKITDEQE